MHPSIPAVVLQCRTDSLWQCPIERGGNALVDDEGATLQFCAFERNDRGWGALERVSARPAGSVNLIVLGRLLRTENRLGKSTG